MNRLAEVIESIRASIKFIGNRTEAIEQPIDFIKPRLLPNIIDDPSLTLDEIPSHWMPYLRVKDPTQMRAQGEDKPTLESVPSACPSCGAQIGIFKSHCPGCGTDKARIYVEDESVKPAPKDSPSMFASPVTWNSSSEIDFGADLVMVGDSFTLKSRADVDCIRANVVELQPESTSKTIISPRVIMHETSRAGAILTDDLTVSGCTIAEVIVPDNGVIRIGAKVKIGRIICGKNVKIYLMENGSSVGELCSIDDLNINQGRWKFKDDPVMSLISSEDLMNNINRYLLTEENK